MKRSELSEFAVEEEGFKLKIRRGINGPPIVTRNHIADSPPTESGGSAASLSAPANAAVANSLISAEDSGIGYIKSPMVGTFYRAATPESKPFVDKDSAVADNTVVCIIEAMKIMNEIQAETSGTVVEALVENGQPVEYGQRLFKVKLG